MDQKQNRNSFLVREVPEKNTLLDVLNSKNDDFFVIDAMVSTPENNVWFVRKVMFDRINLKVTSISHYTTSFMNMVEMSGVIVGIYHPYSSEAAKIILSHFWKFMERANGTKKTI